MKSKTLRIFIGLSVLLMLLVMGFQYYWFQKAYSLEDQDFDLRVKSSLRLVSQRILKYNNNPNNLILKPVERVTNNYYTVRINDNIDPSVLEEFLKQELARHDLKLNFEYGIYDCTKNRIRYGGYICATANCDSTSSVKYQFPDLKLNNYYFGVYFSDRKLNLINEMGVWALSTGILAIIFCFFAYALWVIFRQKRLSEIQTDFINNMTHEFKTPLSTISISSEALMKPNILHKPERLLSYATIINKEALRLRKNVDTVLQTSNMVEKNTFLSKETFCLHQLLEEIAVNLRLNITDKNGTLQLQLKAKQTNILADRQHLANVFHNLVDNALKYCSKSPKISLKTSQSGENISIEILDNGIGLTEKDQGLIFTKFFRVHTGNIHNVKGFGLGLYYVKEIITAHKGQISVKSKLGEGSTFCIQLPLVQNS
jgi:two-component system, OmpR family, phosphate regulon sensor histidine kinase PhoR